MAAKFDTEHGARDQSMRCYLAAVMAVASVLAAWPCCGARSAIGELIDDPKLDPATCYAAAAAQSDPDQIINSCGGVIDNEKARAADRLKALLARAGAYVSKQQDDRAIADYDVALQLDPKLADIFNARGELWRRKGDRPRALADFGAALKLVPQHPAARANYKSLALELERLGAQMALGNQPSFSCAAVKRAVEKAICADPALANLDRQIDRANAMVVREAGGDAMRRQQLLRQHEVYLATRNASFGRPGYDLLKAMKTRLEQLLGTDGY